MRSARDAAPARRAGGPDLPAGSPERLATRVARRTSSRLRRVAGALSRPPLAGALPGARAVLRAVRDGLAVVPPSERHRLLCGPDLRGFLNEAETWIAARDLAGRRDAAGQGRLFDRVSRTEHLATLLPSGRIDSRFRTRVRRFAVRRLGAALDDLAAFAVGLRIAWPARGTLRLRLTLREDPEQGRPANRLDLGAIAGPAGALAIAAARPHGRLVARIRGTTLVLRGPGGVRGGGAGGVVEAVFPAAGSPIRFPETGQGAGRAGSRPGNAPGNAPWSLLRRDTIPGTPILLAPVVTSGPRGFRIGRPQRSIARRLADALRLVQIAWPEGHRMVLRQTWMVIPVREPGTVSWSLAARPGISFINPFGKTRVDLADDLLHESAHHLLHDMQEVSRLLRPGPDTGEVQAFDSPWRGAKRPLHGILHGVFTFLHRAALFRRILDRARSQPRVVRGLLGGVTPAWIARELGKERQSIAAALADLRSASREGLLAPAGRALLRTLEAGPEAPRAGRVTRPRRPPRAARAAGRARGR